MSMLLRLSLMFPLLEEVVIEWLFFDLSYVAYRVYRSKMAFENEVQKIISKKRTNGSRVSAIIYFRAKNSRSKFKI